MNRFALVRRMRQKVTKAPATAAATALKRAVKREPSPERAAVAQPPQRAHGVHWLSGAQADRRAIVRQHAIFEAVAPRHVALNSPEISSVRGPGPDRTHVQNSPSCARSACNALKYVFFTLPSEQPIA